MSPLDVLPDALRTVGALAVGTLVLAAWTLILTDALDAWASRGAPRRVTPDRKTLTERMHP